MKTFTIICLALNCFILINLAIQAISFRIKNRKFMEDIILRIAHQYKLMDILCGGVPSLTRVFYAKLREMGPDKMPKTPQEELALLKDMAFEKCSICRTILLERITSTDDEEEKAHYKNHLERMDGAVNLLSTLDENSSEEYVKKVLIDIAATTMEG
jgi:hypothetical protein